MTQDRDDPRRRRCIARERAEFLHLATQYWPVVLSTDVCQTRREVSASHRVVSVKQK